MKPVVIVALAVFLAGCANAFRAVPEMSFEYQDTAQGPSVSCTRGAEPSDVQQLNELIGSLRDMASAGTQKSLSNGQAIVEPSSIDTAVSICMWMLAGAEEE